MLVRVDSSRERKPCQPSGDLRGFGNRCHRSATRILPYSGSSTGPGDLERLPGIGAIAVRCLRSIAST
jgi:hypothetical protein